MRNNMSQAAPLDIQAASESSCYEIVGEEKMCASHLGENFQHQIRRSSTESQWELFVAAPWAWSCHLHALQHWLSPNSLFFALHLHPDKADKCGQNLSLGGFERRPLAVSPSNRSARFVVALQGQPWDTVPYPCPFSPVKLRPSLPILKLPWPPTLHPNSSWLSCEDDWVHGYYWIQKQALDSHPFQTLDVRFDSDH